MSQKALGSPTFCRSFKIPGDNLYKYYPHVWNTYMRTKWGEEGYDTYFGENPERKTILKK